MRQPRARLAMLNGMAGADIIQSLDRQASWGIRDLDLKNQIWGKAILDLTDQEAATLARQAASRGMAVHCLSSQLFHADIAELVDGLASVHLRQARRLAELSAILRPRFVRLLAPYSARAAAMRQAIATGGREIEPLFAAMRSAIDALTAPGTAVTIENEAHDCLLGHPDAVRSFFARLERPQASFTWDVQNQWQNGSYPSLEAYRTLRPLVRYFHLKGGRADDGSQVLRWRSCLADASWPLVEITRAVIADGCSPVICLNPSHGATHQDWPMDDAVGRDIAWLRTTFPEIA
jgi:sugar phosphate isomerase/epimerase